MAMLHNEISELVSLAIVLKLEPLVARFNTLTYDNWKVFAVHILSYKKPNGTAYFGSSFASSGLWFNENPNGLLYL